MTTSVVAQYWDLERIDMVSGAICVQIAKDSSGRLYVCYDGTDTAGRVVRAATRDSAGWQLQDIFRGRLDGGQPCFTIGPHDEMCAACLDASWVPWLAEQNDSGWTSHPYPLPNAGDVSVAYDTAGTLHCGYVIDDYDFWVGERTDTVWSSTWIYHAFATGLYIMGNHCLRFSPDNRLWYLAANYWEFETHAWGSTMALLRGTGPRWDTVWQDNDVGYHAVALATNRDTTGFCRYGGPLGPYLHCNDEIVEPIWYWQDAGMAYDSSGVPHLAYLSDARKGPVRYAFRTNRWHIDTVPGSSQALYTDLVLDDQGQPLIVFGTPDSGVWLAHGVGVVATEEPMPTAGLRASTRFLVHPNPCGEGTTIELLSPLSENLSLRLFDVSGRTAQTVLLRPGQRCLNLDLGALPGGVYFIGRQDSPTAARVRLVKLP